MLISRTLVDAATAANLPTDDVLFVDCRFDLADAGKGDREYAAGHIVGAVRGDLDRDLADMATPSNGRGRHPLPEASAFSAWLSQAGWRPDLQVIAYDAAGGALAAARFWWLARLAGIDNVAVLDGGWAAWLEANYPVDAGTVRREATSVHVAFDEAGTVAADELAEGVASGRFLLLDARAAPRYRGDIEPLDPVAGHVPGARNHPFADNLDAHGRFQQPEVLRRDFNAMMGTHAAEDVVHMCGSGVTACHNLLAMEYAGLCGSRLYAPSWSGWVSDRSRGVALGEG
ncbi:sulfurtransferase [Luteibacter rhizovicinus DSM 16549]|uniref:Sulfurtransferase n=1 Tax=Luteibacter rhizovicinus DSM 16549 TaxID=1440763 RepID=A0A0G9HKZ4_9GAMM|nr:sulfurtransferase [Luteibacter rhizovicinus]APG04594.1 sulfurtransferase [Luteibacter rhizovicinus DSM 16549]KLD68362.1 sulfurtransferase [Luteibacter rhizovicinus DSM 16549]KLD74532.1 sulfurtransferase [Xanthomonas hyacinthi DSM 19077]